MFTDKVIWITGASSGIGESMAYAFSESGAKLVLTARREDELQRVKASCANPEEILLLPADLADTSGAAEWAKQVIGHFGRIDILINNAGVGQKSRAIETLEKVERQIMEVNYFSTVNMSKAVIPYMQKQQEGKIVVVSSIIGKFGLPLLSSYAASKFALHGYYESLREEVRKDNIKVQIISPGFIKTNVTEKSLTADGSIYNKSSDAQEKGMPTEIFAKKLTRVIRGNRNHAYIGGMEILAVYFHRYLPKLFYNIMRKISKS